jgi:beta-glucosidase
LAIRTQSGNAIAQVLYGDYNPSGKLPMTFLEVWGKCLYFTITKTGRPEMAESGDVFGHIILMKKNDASFGYGLSYSEYSRIQISFTNKNERNIEVSVTLKNTGKYSGKEVVQLYIRDLFAGNRAVKELKV